MGSRRKDDKELRDKWLESYRENRCLLVTTCEKVGIDSNTVDEWNRLFPEFSESKRKLEQSLAEKVEHSLVGSALAEKPNTIAQIFYLKHNTEKYSENMENRQFIDVQNLWFNKTDDKKQLNSPNVSQE